MYCTLASSSPVSLQSLSPELFSCCCVFLSPSYILLLSCYFFPMLLCTPASLLHCSHVFSVSSPLLHFELGFPLNKIIVSLTQVEMVTYEPNHGTFEMDIMRIMGIKEDRVAKKTYWY